MEQFKKYTDKFSNFDKEMKKGNKKAENYIKELEVLIKKENGLERESVDLSNAKDKQLLVIHELNQEQRQLEE